MRRATLILVMLLPAMLVMTATAVRARRQPEWQRALVAYASLNGPSVSAPLSMQIVEEADAPQRFGIEMSASVLGDNPYYRMDGSYTGHSYQSGPRPVPYPPSAVWCAFLKREDAQDSESDIQMPGRIVYVAEHRDLYNGAILIHKVAENQNTAAILQDLRKVGCDHVAAHMDLLGVP